MYDTIIAYTIWSPRIWSLKIETMRAIRASTVDCKSTSTFITTTVPDHCPVSCIFMCYKPTSIISIAAWSSLSTTTNWNLVWVEVAPLLGFSAASNNKIRCNGQLRCYFNPYQTPNRVEIKLLCCKLENPRV
jgi:hypothetical protein